MNFTKEQLTTLSNYERHFYTAINAGYCSNPGKTALETIHAIWVSHTGVNEHLNTNCANCVLRLIKAVGRCYFDDIIESKNHDEFIKKTKEVTVEDIPAEPVKKAVKTTRKKKTANAI